MRWGAVVCTAVLIVGCGQGDTTEGIPIDAGRSDASRVLRFYLGSFMTAAEVDSVLVHHGSSWSLRFSALAAFAPDLHGALSSAVADGRIHRDELQAAVQATYARARGFPDRVDHVAAIADLEADPEAWITHGVRGSMTRFERRVSIPVAAVVAAIRSFVEGSGLVYPVGTTVVGRHLDEDRVVETTLMARRGDGFWDFAAWDSDGRRIDRIEGDPDPLDVPVQCFGCHYGTRLFEPERSFPVRPPDGPHGPRFVDAPEQWVDPDAVGLFDEHRRRSDGLLGLYATLLVGRWRAESGRGTLPAEYDSLLDALGR